MNEYNVPDDFGTLSEAVAEAETSTVQDNFININAPRIFTSPIVLGNNFSNSRKLTIRPAPNLPRAAICMQGGGDPIFRTFFAGDITFQDLDILRSGTNTNDIMFISDSHKITIERCRIGSIWSSSGARGWSNLRIKDPNENIVRNSICFAYCQGTFDYGIRIDFTTAENDSLFLYNNVVADYNEYGISATSPMFSDAFFLLRNNLVVNHPNIDQEPVPFYSAIFDMMVETSYNAAFVSLLEDVDDTVPGAQHISGDEGVGFLRRSRSQVNEAFIKYTWIIDPEWDPNFDFFRLVRGGPLHHEPGDAGINVYDGDPHSRDIAVTDDITRFPRPNGLLLHTDRGAYQIREGDSFVDLRVNLGDIDPPPL